LELLEGGPSTWSLELRGGRHRKSLGWIWRLLRTGRCFVNVVLEDEDEEGDAQYKRWLERQEKKRDRQGWPQHFSAEEE
jgi:hypothetical protein